MFKDIKRNQFLFLFLFASVLVSESAWAQHCKSPENVLKEWGEKYKARGKTGRVEVVFDISPDGRAEHFYLEEGSELLASMAQNVIRYNSNNNGYKFCTGPDRSPIKNIRLKLDLGEPYVPLRGDKFSKPPYAIGEPDFAYKVLDRMGVSFSYGSVLMSKDMIYKTGIRQAYSFAEVYEEGLAWQHGIRRGDLLMAVNGHRVDKGKSFQMQTEHIFLGNQADTLELSLMRRSDNKAKLYEYEPFTVNLPFAKRELATVTSKQPEVIALTKKSLVTLITEPTFPPVQRASGRQLSGHVVMRFTINADGSVAAPEVIESRPNAVFDESSLAGILSAKYAGQLPVAVATGRVDWWTGGANFSHLTPGPEEAAQSTAVQDLAGCQKVATAIQAFKRNQFTSGAIASARAIDLSVHVGADGVVKSVQSDAQLRDAMMQWLAKSGAICASDYGQVFSLKMSTSEVDRELTAVNSELLKASTDGESLQHLRTEKQYSFFKRWDSNDYLLNIKPVYSDLSLEELARWAAGAIPRERRQSCKPTCIVKVISNERLLGYFAAQLNPVSNRLAMSRVDSYTSQPIMLGAGWDMVHMQNLANKDLALINLKDVENEIGLASLYFEFAVNYGDQCLAAGAPRESFERVVTETKDYGLGGTVDREVSRTSYTVEPSFARLAKHFRKNYVYGAIRFRSNEGSMRSFFSSYACNSSELQNVRTSMLEFEKKYDELNN